MRDLEWVFNCPKCQTESNYASRVKEGDRIPDFSANIVCQQCKVLFKVKFHVPPEFNDTPCACVEARFVPKGGQ